MSGLPSIDDYLPYIVDLIASPLHIENIPRYANSGIIKESNGLRHRVMDLSAIRHLIFEWFT